MKTILYAALVWGALGVSPTLWAQQKQFDVPATQAVRAIPEFARQAGVQIVAPADEIRGILTPEIKGTLDVRAALKRLLVGTGLEIASDDGAIITLRRAEQTSGRLDEATAPLASAQAPLEPALDEVVITAQKRGAERLQDVPIPVSVLDGQSLGEGNLLRAQDYYMQVPGLSLDTLSGPSLDFSIRGISTGCCISPVVGVTIDDVPMTTPVNGQGFLIPDLDPSDLAQVEVLRGPQGTLYGASSMGGLVRYVTIDPSMSGFNGRVEAGASGVYHGAQAGYHFRASVNVPLNDTLAVRASAFTRQDPGYLNNPILGIRGINEDHVSGGRLAVLWRPSDAWSVKLTAQYQNDRADSTPEVTVQQGLSGLEQGYVRGGGASSQSVQSYTATVKAQLGGGINLTSVSGYNIVHTFNVTDQSLGFEPIVEPAYGVGGALNDNNYGIRNFTQEIRFQGALPGHIDWLGGLFYAHDNTADAYTLLATDPQSGAVAAHLFAGSYPLFYRAYAVFGDLTFHLTDRFNVQVGGRKTEEKEHAWINGYGVFTPVFYCVPMCGFNGTAYSYGLAETSLNENSFTYLVTPQYHLTQDLMLYVRLASGFRPGLINQGEVGIPLTDNPDKTYNYELGTKGEFFNRRLRVDASVYYIDWKDIQLNAITPQNLGYLANGARAKSQGVEFSVEAQPWKGATVSGWIAYDDAVLTQPLPPAAVAANNFGLPGDRLPNSTRQSGYLSVKQAFPLWNQTTGYAAFNVSYVGDRWGLFQGLDGSGSPLPRQHYPAYAKADFHTGLNVDAWAVNFFVNNVTDRRGLLNGGIGYFPSNAFLYLTPRTVGVNVSRRF